MGVCEDTRSLEFISDEELTLQPRYTNVNTWQAARRSHQACARPLDSLIDVGSAVQDAECELEGTALSTVMHICMTVCGVDIKRGATKEIHIVAIDNATIATIATMCISFVAPLLKHHRC